MKDEIDEVMSGEIKKGRIRRFVEWLGNYVARMGVFMFFLHVGSASIYYIYKTVYMDMGMQPQLLESATLVILVVIGSFVLTRKVMKI